MFNSLDLKITKVIHMYMILTLLIAKCIDMFLVCISKENLVYQILSSNKTEIIFIVAIFGKKEALFRKYVLLWLTLELKTSCW